MPLRALGRTGEKVSLAGLGCVQIGNRRVSDDQAVAILRRAVELGINYVDTAPTYGRGESERKIGLALKRTEGLRRKIFLTSKTLERKKKDALAELDASLNRLGTDHVDLWQFHALQSTRDMDGILAEDGALAAAKEAKKAGKIRFVGITGHYDPDVFVDALKRHDFDTLLIPLNCIDPHHRSFEETALPFANRKGTGVIAMKVFCSGGLPKKDIVDAETCLRYTFGLPISTCIVGCASVKEVELAAHVARNLKTMDDDERAATRAKTKPHSPGLEWYKRKN